MSVHFIRIIFDFGKKNYTAPAQVMTGIIILYCYFIAISYLTFSRKMRQAFHDSTIGTIECHLCRVFDDSFKFRDMNHVGM